MPVEVYINNLNPKIRFNVKKFKSVIRKILKKEGAHHAQISFVVVDNRRMRSLNKKFLKRELATDVIAFPLDKVCLRKKSPPVIIGEAYISSQMAKERAIKMGIRFPEELLRYFIHATLHILGYTDKIARERKQMWKKQEDSLSYGLRSL